MSAPGHKQKAEESKVDWQTPPELFNYLNKMYKFTVDGAASSRNAKCNLWFDEEYLNAFDQNPTGETIWVNPPYGKLLPWMELFAKWGKDNIVVALVPTAPDTEWWNYGNVTAVERLLLGPGRVKFINPETGKPGNSNTTASTLFTYSSYFKSTGISVWNWRKDVFSN